MNIETKDGAAISLRPHRLQCGKLAALNPKKPKFWRDIDFACHLHIVDPNDPTKVLRNFLKVPLTKTGSGKATKRGNLMLIMERPGDLPDDTISVTDPNGGVESHDVRRVSFGSPSHRRLLEDVRDQTNALSRLDHSLIAWLIEDMGELHIKTITPSSTRAHEEWVQKTAGGELGILERMAPVTRAHFEAQRLEHEELRIAVEALRARPPRPWTTEAVANLALGAQTTADRALADAAGALAAVAAAQSGLADCTRTAREALAASRKATADAALQRVGIDSLLARQREARQEAAHAAAAAEAAAHKYSKAVLATLQPQIAGLQAAVGGAIGGLKDLERQLAEAKAVAADRKLADRCFALDIEAAKEAAASAAALAEWTHLAAVAHGEQLTASMQRGEHFIGKLVNVINHADGKIEQLRRDAMVSFDLVKADVVCLQEQINLNPPPAPLMPDELAVPETPQGHAQPKGDTAADTAADTPEWLQAATADLGAASGGSSWLAVGANVLYRSAGGTLEHATVRAVHSDDLTAPCYTIEFDGTERWTEGDRLLKPDDAVAPASGLVFFDLAAAPTAASAPVVSGLRGVQGALASNCTGRRTSSGTSGRASVAKPTRVPAAVIDLTM